MNQSHHFPRTKLAFLEHSEDKDVWIVHERTRGHPIEIRFERAVVAFHEFKEISACDHQYACDPLSGIDPCIEILVLMEVDMVRLWIQL